MDHLLPGDAGRMPERRPDLTTLDFSAKGQPNTADSVYVFLIAEKGGKRDLVIYSGLNGYHIRTIPAERFSNPVYVSGGDGLLVVVDRYGDRDLIRVTDLYGGAGADAFDDNGFPKTSVDWRNVRDIQNIHIGDGKQVTGIQLSILGELIVGLSGITHTTILFADVRAMIDAGITSNTDLMAGTTITEPYTRMRLISADQNLGEPCGSPAFGSGRIGETHRWAFLSTWDSTNGVGAILVFDTLYRRLQGALGLPTGFRPLSTSHSSQIVSVSLVDVSDPMSQMVVRVLFSEKSAFFVGKWNNGIPLAGDGDADRTFKVLDHVGDFDSKTELLHYLRFTSVLTLGDERSISDRAALLSSVTGLPENWYAPTTHTGQREANLDRVPENVFYDTAFYRTTAGSASLGTITVPAQVIRSTGNIVRAGNSTLNTVAEATFHGAEASPLFILLHNTHYDWFSEGGGMYGCGSDILNNGYTPIAIGTMRGVEVGTLKDLPDLRAALIDSETGLFLYRDAKPRGYKMYSGTYASLAVADGVRETDCTASGEANATAIDGIPRPGKGLSLSYPPEFSLDTDLDRPFELFKRSVAPTGPISAALTQKSWSIRDDDGAFNYVWVLPGAGHAQEVVNNINYPPSGAGGRNPGTLSVSNTAGFFYMDLPKARTTRRSLLTDERIDLAAERELLIAAGGDYSAQDSRIAAIDEELSTSETLDVPTYQVPRSYFKRRYTGLEPTSPATLVEETVENASGADGEVIVLPTLRRGAVLTPGTRSWVGVEVLLDRWDGDGVEAWSHPETTENGLGVPVGDYVTGISEGFRLTGSQVFESGYKASEGALGKWEVDIYLNGVKADTFAEKITYPDQITELAPSEAQESLYSTFTAGRGNGRFEKYHKGKVYFTDKTVTTVEVKARLVNIAFSVYRTGFRTVRRIGGNNFFNGAFTCWGTDPGFYGGDTCESLGCGNVSCSSALFFGSKLYAADPIYRWTRQIVWEGSAVYTVPVNPYADAGFAVGTVQNCYFDFNLNATLSRFKVDIRDGKGPIQ